jgi:hypothetical protein
VALPPPRALPYDPRAGTAAALDALLDAIEFGASHYRCWLDMMIMAAVVCAGDVDAEDMARPPFEPRDTAPVTVVAIARVLGIPYSTVRRHVENMLRDAALRRRRGGVIAVESWLDRPAVARDRRIHADHVRRLVTRLAPAGFPFDAPASAYLAGPPPRLDFTSEPVAEEGDDQPQ